MGFRILYTHHPCGVYVFPLAPLKVTHLWFESTSALLDVLINFRAFESVFENGRRMDGEGRTSLFLSEERSGCWSGSLPQISVTVPVIVCLHYIYTRRNLYPSVCFLKFWMEPRHPCGAERRAISEQMTWQIFQGTCRMQGLADAGSTTRHLSASPCRCYPRVESTHRRPGKDVRSCSFACERCTRDGMCVRL